MAESGSTVRPAPRSTGGRLRFAWRNLPPERRLAATAAVALFATLFLPWYQETVIPTGFGARTALPSATLTGWAAFSFVEAAVLLISLSVLALLFARAEGRAFHVPGGDGGVITGAGFWTGVLIVWRMFDKSGADGYGQFVTTSGIEWGIFMALAVSGLLAYSGQRIRLQHTPEPPLPGERPVGRGGRRGRRGRPDRRPPESADPDAGWLTPEAPRRGVSRRPSSRSAAPTSDARGVSRSDAQAIGFDDPPEAPTVRRDSPELPTVRRDSPEAPTVRRDSPEVPAVRRAAGPDEQLKIPLEPPE